MYLLVDGIDILPVPALKIGLPKSGLTAYRLTRLPVWAWELALRL
jgi:hypothetical protein